jgi:hypothetical protein
VYFSRYNFIFLLTMLLYSSTPVLVREPAKVNSYNWVQKVWLWQLNAFITYLLLYPVDITHNINFNYYTVYFYATHNVKNVTWRSLLLRVDCDITNKRQLYVVCLQINVTRLYSPNEKQVLDGKYVIKRISLGLWFDMILYPTCYVISTPSPRLGDRKHTI